MKKGLLILLCMPMIGFGQGWEKYFVSAYSSALSVKQTSDGGFIFAGGYGGNGWDENAYVVKTNNLGLEQWSNTFVGDGFSTASSVIQTSDGGFLLCGTTSDTSYNSKAFVVKMNSSGVEQWSNTFVINNQETYSQAIIEEQNGGYMILGNWNSSNVGVPNDLISYLLKIDSIGNKIWDKSYGVSSDWGGRNLLQTDQGDFLFVGGIDTLVGRYAVLTKVNSIGNKVWKKIFSINFPFASGSGVLFTDNNEIVVSGTALDINNSSPISSNIYQTYIFKTDSSGNEIWNNTFSYQNEVSNAEAIILTSDGGYASIGCTIDTLNEIYYSSLIKWNSNGGIVWTQKFPGMLHSYGTSLQQTNDSGIVFCGFTSITDDVDDEQYAYLVKTDGNGNITSTFNIPTPNSNRKLEKVVDILGKKNKPQTNQPLFYIYDDGTVEKKIILE